MEALTAHQIGYLIVTLGFPVSAGVIAFAVIALDDLVWRLRDRL